MKTIYQLFGILMTLALGLTACQASDPTPAYSYGENAIIESLEVLILESFPVQVQVIVSGQLPDGCTELDEISVEQKENVFDLTVQTRRPTGDIACTMALVPFSETVALDVAGLAAGTYTVTAQDQSADFTLTVDNVIQE